MQLSPLNTIGMIQRIRKDENDQGLKDESGVEEIVMYRCKSCGETYEWKSEAEDCCPQLDTCNKPACPVRGNAPCATEFHRAALSVAQVQ